MICYGDLKMHFILFFPNHLIIKTKVTYFYAQ